MPFCRIVKQINPSPAITVNESLFCAKKGMIPLRKIMNPPSRKENKKRYPVALSSSFFPFTPHVIFIMRIPIGIIPSSTFSIYDIPGIHSTIQYPAAPTILPAKILVYVAVFPRTFRRSVSKYKSITRFNTNTLSI